MINLTSELDDRPLALEALEALCEELDRPLVEELVEQFLAELPERLEACAAAVAAQDWKAAERHAHSFLGAAGTLGLETASQAASWLEQAARAAEPSRCANALAALQQAAAVADLALTRWSMSAETEGSAR